MSFRFLLLSGLLCLAATISSAGQAPTFKSSAEAVFVDVLVTERGRPVPGLSAADFELRDNGVVQQVSLVSFEQIPLNVVFVFDLSGSVSGQRLEDLRRAGHGLLDGLKKDDQAALITMTHAVTQESALSRDLGQIRAALDSAQPWGATALVDASFTGMMVGESTIGRALIMVFSDGLDTSSWLAPDRVLDIAKQSDVVVYGIAAGRHKSPFLPDLTSATGGRMLEVDSTRNLAGVFVSILEEFRQRYLLTYTPRGVETGGWHSLEVRVKRRGIKVNARPGYQRDLPAAPRVPARKTGTGRGTLLSRAGAADGRRRFR